MAVFFDSRRSDAYDGALMLNGILPNQVDARKLTTQGAEIKGILEGSELPRLAGAVEEAASVIEVALEFGLDESGNRVISGKISTDVTMICQRCLEPVVQNIQAEVNVGLVWDDKEASNLPKSLDPLIVTEAPLVLKELVEEELLLSLPIVAYHGVCDGHSRYVSESPEVPEQAVEKKESPFDVLKQLKK